MLLGLYEVDIFGLNFADYRARHHARLWILYALILILYTIVNIFPDRFIQLMNNVSVGWHLLGVAIVIGILIFVPDTHQSPELRVHREDQQQRCLRGLDQRRSASGSWCCPSASC